MSTTGQMRGRLRAVSRVRCHPTRGDRRPTIEIRRRETPCSTTSTHRSRGRTTSSRTSPGDLRAQA